MKQITKIQKTETRFRRTIKQEYKPKDSPRLKQLYVNKYLSISAQYVIRWQDMFKVGYSTCPGMFLHAVAMPEFIKAKGISRWPLLTLTAFNIAQLHLHKPYPDILDIAQLLNADIKVIRAAFKWCLFRNFIMKVNQGYRGRRSDGTFGSQHYYLTLMGQEILNEYFHHCHQYYDEVTDKLRNPEMKKYLNY